MFLEDAGVFLSDSILKFEFSLDHEFVKLEQPVVESLNDFKIDTPTHARVELLFASIRNVLLGDDATEVVVFSRSNASQIDFIQAQDHDFPAIIDLKTVEDLPNPTVSSIERTPRHLPQETDLTTCRRLSPNPRFAPV